MRKVCPISFEQINERVARVNAALVFFSLLVFMLTSFKWIVFILGIDFLVRGFLNPSFSLFSAISKNVIRILKIKPVMVNAGPKIFAARIGFAFCCAIALCYIFDFYRTSFIFSSIFMFFAALEAIFGFCIACRIYPFICKTE